MDHMTEIPVKGNVARTDVTKCVDRIFVSQQITNMAEMWKFDISSDQGNVKTEYIIIIIIIISGSAAQRGLWPPHSRGFLITHNDLPQSVGLLLDE
jgi:hypothetical protein